MKTAPIPLQDSERIASLRRMLLLDTPEEESLDRITRLAQALFKAPIALISLVDRDRQWFKSCFGLNVNETSRDISFCGHAIMGDDVFLIENALADPRFADNPLVTTAPHIRFYAGYPLTNPEGFKIGTLCVIDTEPREFGQVQQAQLADLGSLVELVLRHRQLTTSQTALLAELDFLKHAALMDPRLRIWNTSAIQDILGKELTLARNESKPLMVAKLCCQDYRNLLEQDCKDTAESMMLEVLRQLRKHLPESMHAGRLLDDQILLVWSVSNVEDCVALAESIDRQLSSLRLGPPWSAFLTIPRNSVGVVICGANNRDDITVIDLLSAADHCLQTASSQSGNCVSSMII